MAEKKQEPKHEEPAPNVGREVFSREQPIRFARKGRCHVCGCKVYRTETICGECICEVEGCD